MEKLEQVAKLCQNCASHTPVIVLGSGASIPHGIKGMGDLALFLKSKVDPSGGPEIDAWNEVLSRLEAGKHLEESLIGVQLPQNLVVKIVQKTWEFIATDDFQLFKASVAGKVKFPLTRLFSGQFKSTNKNIDVITPNYDRVVEYATDLGGFIHHNGFFPGYLRRTVRPGDLRYFRSKDLARTVTLWKVHGSLDWFIDGNHQVISLPLMTEILADLVPLIVTPGVSKYERTHEEPFRTAIQGADRVLQDAAAVICVGYGFRDSHIQPKLLARCSTANVPVIVCARTLTPEAHEFLKNRAGQNFVALEADPVGTKAYTSDWPDGEIIEDENLWELDSLNDLLGY